MALDSLRSAGLGELLPHRRGVAARSAAGTMVFSRYPLGRGETIRDRQGRPSTCVVAAPEPFRLLAVHPVQPKDLPRGWVRDLEAIRVRAALAVDRGPDDGGG